MPVADPYAALRDAHVDAVRKALRRHRGDCVASHVSAAVVDGMSAYRLPDRPQLTRPVGSRRRNVSVAGLPPGDVTIVNDIPVTAAARTVFDCARSLPFLAALVTADSAMRGGVGAAALQNQLVEKWNWPHASRAREVVRWTDPRAESPLESIVRGRCILLGLPVPEPQVKVSGADGVRYRVDLYWEQFRLIGEADGRLKYADESVLWAEKQRRDTLEERHSMIRWTWRQAHAPDDVFRGRVLAAFAQAERKRQLLGV